MKIYGHSDDCIEVEGTTIREEFNLYDQAVYLRFDTGLVIKCTFCDKDDEAWRFTVVHPSECNSVEEFGPNEDGDYHLIVSGTMPKSVVCDDTPCGPSGNRARDILEQFDGWGDLSDEHAKQIVSLMRNELGVIQ